MHITAIVLAAGKGLRFKARVSKPLVKINSRPAILYSLRALSRHPAISDIIVVVNPGNRKGVSEAIKRSRINKISKVVLGGRRRQDSVESGLKAAGDLTGLVLIHDATRPFIDARIISAVICEAKRTGAAIAGVPVSSTIKSVKVPRCPATKALALRQGVKEKRWVDKTLQRERLWEIQTPQAFRKELILEAYRRFGNLEATDDAMLVEKLGAGVRVVQGSYNNIKITTRGDLLLAEAIAKSKEY